MQVYTLNNITAADAANYDVVITGTCGNLTSNIASLTVNTAPAITAQPVSLTQCAGTNATFTVTATGTGLTYQWRKNAVNIAGATNASYTINNITATDAASYTVVITGTCGNLTSAAATLHCQYITGHYRSTCKPHPLQWHKSHFHGNGNRFRTYIPVAEGWHQYRRSHQCKLYDQQHCRNRCRKL